MRHHTENPLCYEMVILIILPSTEMLLGATRVDAGEAISSASVNGR